jgi:hypothetical protein
MLSLCAELRRKHDHVIGGIKREWQSAPAVWYLQFQFIWNDASAPVMSTWQFLLTLRALRHSAARSLSSQVASYKQTLGTLTLKQASPPWRCCFFREYVARRGEARRVPVWAYLYPLFAWVMVGVLVSIRVYISHNFSIPYQVMWDLRWINWHWGRCSPSTPTIPVTVSHSLLILSSMICSRDTGIIVK